MICIRRVIQGSARKANAVMCRRTSITAARHIHRLPRTRSSHHKLLAHQAVTKGSLYFLKGKQVAHLAVAKGSVYLLKGEAVAHAKGSVYLLKGEAVAHDGPGMGGAAVLGDGFLG